MEVDNENMWLTYTCTHLPNKIAANPPDKTEFNSDKSGTVNKWGVPIFGVPTDWGSHKLTNMGSTDILSIILIIYNINISSFSQCTATMVSCFSLRWRIPS